MKKIVHVMMVVCFITILELNYAYALETAMGDVNNNGVVDAADALCVLRHAAKLELIDEDAQKIADVTADYVIDAKDALDILFYVAKKIDFFIADNKNTSIPKETKDPIGGNEDNKKETEAPVLTEIPQETPVITEQPTEIPQCSISVDETDAPYVLINQTVLNYIRNNGNIPIETFVKEERKLRGRLDYSIPVNLHFSVNHLSETLCIEDIKIAVSESADLTDARVIHLNPNDRTISIDLLKTGAQYYYNIQIKLTNGEEICYKSKFKTADSPRILSIDGINNVRDIGGWMTENGQKIREGFFYRGSEFDGAVEPNYRITDFGKEKMCNVLGIKTDMDMRSYQTSWEADHLLGENIEHIYYGIGMYSNIFLPANKKQIQKIFSKLADPSAYPVYLHCTYGRDRTGTVCYLLEALLGLDEIHLIKEYELSSLYNEFLDRKLFQGMIENLKREYEGNSIQQKVNNYLYSCGVTSEDIEQIKSILLE